MPAPQPAAPQPTALTIPAPILVGRDAELRLLTEAAAAAPAVLVVEGEAGVGKTRLVHEALLALAPRPALVGAAHPLGDPFPLGPVLEALRGANGALDEAATPLLGVLAPLLPELADRLPAPPEPLADPRAEQHRRFRAILELLERIGPVSLVLEDLHWADRATLELLRYLLHDLPRNVTLILTYRREDLADPASLDALVARPPAGATSLRLAIRPLPAEEVRTLIGAILGTDRVSETFAHYLHERSNGLPLAVEEMIRLLGDRRDIVRRGGGWARRAIEDIEIPHALRGLFLERVQGLAADARAVTEAAAVLRGGEEGLLLEVAELPFPRGVVALSEAIAGGVLEEAEDGIGFRHPLARDAVESALPGPRRRALHLRAAEALERRSPTSSERLAHHYAAAGRASKLVEHATEVAREARARRDDHRAVEILSDALRTHAGTPAQRVRLALALAEVALDALVHDEAIPILEAVAAEAVPRRARGQLALELGRLLVQAGRGAEAEPWFEEASAELWDRPAFAARALANLALPTTLEHRGWHLRNADRAVELLGRTRDLATRVAVLGDRTATLLSFGEPGAWEAVEDLPAPGRSAGAGRELVRVLHNLAEAAIHLGAYERGAALLSRATEQAHAIGYERFTAHLEALAATLDWARGDWERLPAREAAVEATASSQGPVAQMGLLLGYRALASGDVRRAQELLATAAAQGAEAAWVPLLVAAKAGLARLALMRADPAAAVEELEPALEALRRKDAWVWGGDLAPLAVEAFAASGEPAAAGGIVRELARGIRGRIAPAAAAGLAACRGLLAEMEGRLPAAERSFASAARAWGHLPRPYDAARATAARGALRLRAGDGRGSELMHGALGVFDGLAAAADAGRVRGLLRSHGLRPPGTGGRRAYGSDLSPRERDVARLVAEGMRNRAIAERLFVSTRTVEYHVANLMRKLEAPTRMALALAIRERLGREKTP